MKIKDQDNISFYEIKQELGSKDKQFSLKERKTTMFCQKFQIFKNLTSMLHGLKLKFSQYHFIPNWQILEGSSKRSCLKKLSHVFETILIHFQMFSRVSHNFIFIYLIKINITQLQKIRNFFFSGLQKAKYMKKVKIHYDILKIRRVLSPVLLPRRQKNYRYFFQIKCQ